MARIKGAVNAHKKRRKVMKLAGLEQIVKIEGGNSHEGDQ